MLLHARSRLGSAAAAFALCLGCATQTDSFEIRARDPLRMGEPAERQKAYKEEFQYVHARRSQLLGARPDLLLDEAEKKQSPQRILGLALSGGGIRSATFSLGVLQALSSLDMLDQFDYTSAVSGGGYIAAWQFAHIGARNSLPRDRYEYEVGARTQADLLRNHNEPVEHLRTHSGFLNQGGWFEGLGMAGDYLWRWPFHLILDDVLHLRGDLNFQHIIDIYRARIEGTYFRGEPAPDRGVRPISEFRLVDVNDSGSERLVPYMILNANLTNQGRSRIFGDERPSRDQWSFEFTRDFTGSDATGYIESRGFGLPVEDVHEAKGVPIEAVVELDDADASPFRLSYAVAASGAAFDSLSFTAGISRWWGVNEATHLIGGGIFNMNLGLDAPNFSREYSGWGSIWDYTRMFTFQRIPRLTDPGARWLYITDGGHYENLGVLGLLRRGASCIVAIDASADRDRRFGDLRTLRERVQQDLPLKWASELPSDGSQPVHRFLLTDENDALKAVILYVKASADDAFPHMREQSGDQEVADYTRRLAAIRDDLKRVVEKLLAQLTGAEAVPRNLVGLVTRAEAFQPPQPGRDREAIEERQAFVGELGELLEQRTQALAQAQARAQEQAKQGRQLLMKQAAQTTGGEEPIVEPSEPFPPPADLDQQIEALLAEIDAIRTALQFNRYELEKLKAGPKPLEDFDRLTTEFMEGLEHSIDTSGVARPDETREQWKAEWMARFSLAFTRARGRLDRLQNPEDSAEARRERIARIRAFMEYSWTFPHDPTLIQAYSWERFEAYRLLGYQMARTYLEPLSPADRDGLSWCDFAPAGRAELRP